MNPGAKTTVRHVCLAFLLLLSFPALAIETNEDAAQSPASEDETALDEFLEEADAEAEVDAENEPWVDAHKEYVDTQIDRGIRLWVDGFFVTIPKYEAEDAYSQIRLRPEYLLS